MRTLIIIIAALLSINTSYAQKSNVKLKSKKYRVNVEKLAKRESKKWKKLGYGSLPGSLPLEIQIANTIVKQSEKVKDSDGEPRYLSATGTAKAGSDGVAQANAFDNTRILLAGQVQSKISVLVSSNKASSQLEEDKIETIDEFIQNGKTLIESSMGVLEPSIVMYKKDDKYTEYRYTVLYDVVQVKRMASRMIKEQLREKLDANEDQLNELLDF